MIWIVEVRYTGSDWADLLADMRSWLGRRQINTEEFHYSSAGLGIAFRVGFRSEDQAAAFAEAFGAGCNLRTLAEPPGNGECPARRVMRPIRPCHRVRRLRTMRRRSGCSPPQKRPRLGSL